MASVFSIELDEDYDRISHKVTQRQFSRVYLSWIQHCASKRQDGAVSRKKRDLTLLCMLNTMSAGRYICYLHFLVKPKVNLTGFVLQWALPKFHSCSAKHELLEAVEFRTCLFMINEGSSLLQPVWYSLQLALIHYSYTSWTPIPDNFQKIYMYNYLTYSNHTFYVSCSCFQSQIESIDGDSRLVRLCYALSLVARRALATAAHNNCASVNVEFFLYGLHSLFKGDFRITGETCFWCTVKII